MFLAGSLDGLALGNRIIPPQRTAATATAASWAANHRDKLALVQSLPQRITSRLRIQHGGCSDDTWAHDYLRLPILSV